MNLVARKCVRCGSWSTEGSTGDLVVNGQGKRAWHCSDCVPVPAGLLVDTDQANPNMTREQFEKMRAHAKESIDTLTRSVLYGTILKNRRG